MDLFCASQAATSVHVTSMDSHASSSSSTVHLGSSRRIDRHNPIITDSSRTPKPPLPTPNPTPKNDKSKNGKKKNKKNGNIDFASRISCAKGGGFISPSGSTRFLLGDKTGLLEDEPVFEPVVAPMTPSENTDKFEASTTLDAETGSISNRASSSHRSSQVVVLRVSLHCKGCAGKVKKYISRMQGVTSYNIDFAAKKVTVVGDVTPLDVLASISKVKTAKVWTPQQQPSFVSSISPNIYSEITKSNKTVVA